MKVTFEVGQVWFVAADNETGTPLGVVGYDELRNEVKALLIAEEHRRMGIATVLLNALEIYARSRGKTYVTATTGVSNIPAQKLYEGRGYFKWVKYSKEWE